MKTALKPGDTIYEIGVDAITKEASIQPFTVLCVGEKTVYACGLDVTFNHNKEVLFYFQNENTIDPSEFFSSNFSKVWADSPGKAAMLKATIERIIESKKQFQKAI